MSRNGHVSNKQLVNKLLEYFKENAKLKRKSINYDAFVKEELARPQRLIPDVGHADILIGAQHQHVRGVHGNGHHLSLSFTPKRSATAGPQGNVEGFL